ncbi:hypothetical protein AMATHDRAFT_134787 [Amanita thiersii Skay4041]|uniref:AMP-dependent synthetase/ligase domain-containing protein n=1 Tax=Amanita thiersii Skay4041 TaxID=703135 RepID=A0A2A9P1F6_9AGAR|nr:hypothetical protein AMATHDRAFT_134787 [Amanita thiersii Skay4041]
MLQSHLSILEASASRYAAYPLFRTPRLDVRATSQVDAWDIVTYQHFFHDVEATAKFWARTFAFHSIPQKSVVGLWISGSTYLDLLHVYGVSRAGYIPQLFSLRLPNPVVIYELLHKAGAKALIYESAFQANVADSPVPTFICASRDLMDTSEANLPSFSPTTAEEWAFVFHTSGSTSGSPKLVPCSYKWVDSAICKSGQISRPFNIDHQDVTVSMGSICHIGQTFMFLGSLQHGSCVVLPGTNGFSSNELVNMIERCRINRLNQFASFLANHLRNSRTDCKLLESLQSLDEILYSGLPLARDEEEWANSKGIKLRNLFGNTECGAMLLSIGGKGRAASLLQPLPGTSYTFQPIDGATTPGHHSTGRMLELVILADSPDCPDKSLRHKDGHFHTGDLFVEVASGSYISRGRDDDWIKTENSLRCDTKAIEDNTRSSCNHIIRECVVVGIGRPSPAMFVELTDDSFDHEKVRREVIRKTRHFSSRRYLHERITSPHMIIIVAQNTLPRTTTKGNIRRKAVEEQFKAQLDELYASRHSL